ncbi:MAG TPA: flagellar biosynthetic protein FliO [Anaeromyxobacteraceae bacterium]|nr:flagellar biosynthetic protein FliO [Anaeromyxobacteraceae bacterium]
MRRVLERLSTAAGRRWIALAALGAAAAGAAAWGGSSGGAPLGALGALGLLGAGAAALSRGSARQATGPVEIEARAALARETGVALVRAAGRRFLVGFGPAGVSALAELDRPEGVP